ncbi:MAG: ribonuclease R [bacterium]
MSPPPAARDEFDEAAILRELSQTPGGKLSFHELADRCAIPAKRRQRFRRFLRTLVRDGRLAAAKGRGYRLGAERPVDREWAVEGVVRRHRDGFGFLIRDDEDDLFLPARELGEVFDGDRVRAVPVPGRFGRTAGRVVEVTERKRTSVTGTFRRLGVREIVDPDPEVYGEAIELLPGAVTPRDGEIVEVEIRDFPRGRRPAVGRIVEIVGVPGQLGTILETVIRRHGIARRFPDDVLEEAEALPEAPLDEHLAGREDLAGLPTFTIDPEDARDHDDAVSIEPLAAGGLRLRVSIADVAHWVTAGSPLDREALERGTSAYFPDRVIPMLPERLSSGLASLRPGVTRLTLTAEMDFDREGRRRSSRIYESAIRSWGRWTYAEVARALDGEQVPGVTEHREQVILMAELMRRLRRVREQRGSLDFDLPEPDVVLDATGNPEDVVRSERNDAHRIIEEFMIAANEAVADWFVERRRPTIFRVHATPDLEKMHAFVEFARSFGHEPDFGRLASSKALAEFLESVKGLPAERAIHHILLRTMMRAQYAEENVGHYGLASERYLHFTSPIRRYPDLVVHRLAKAMLHNRPSPIDGAGLVRIAEQSSARETAAARCEFDVLDVLRAWFLRDRVGEEFDGIVSGVIEEGFFVELLDVYVEGMVRVQDLDDDWYRFLPGPRILVGRRLKRRFAIGDPVRVAVQAVHEALGRVELALVRGGSRGARKRG